MPIKDTIRLFVDAHIFDKEFQGTQTFIRELYTVLLRDYPDLDIFFGAADTENISRIFPLAKKTNIIRYKSKGPAFFRYFFDIPAIIRKYHITVAHFQYISPAPVKGCAYVVTTHDILFKDYPSEFPWHYKISRDYLFKKSIRRANIKTTVSSYSKERIAQHYHISDKELHVIPNGVSQSFGNEAGTTDAAAATIKEKYGISNFILYVGRVEPRKNHYLLLKTFLELELYKKNISLVLIGKESIPVPAFNELLSGMDEAARKSVHWLRSVEQAELELFYKAARLFVFLSKAEGFGIPPLEAALCKTPVLSANTTAMKDFTFFEPYRFNPNDPGSFKQQLAHIIDHPPDPAFLEKVRSAVIEHYSWEKSAAVLYHLIQLHLHK